MKIPFQGINKICDIFFPPNFEIVNFAGEEYDLISLMRQIKGCFREQDDIMDDIIDLCMAHLDLMIIPYNFKIHGE